MTITLKPKTEITVPKSVRRKAGLKAGDRVEFKVIGRAITILPKPTPDELEDDLELQDAGVLRAIQQSNADITAGRVKPADLLLSSPGPRKGPKARH